MRVWNTGEEKKLFDLSRELYSRIAQGVGMREIRILNDSGIASHVFKTGGDAFCAAFHTAPDALAAALEAQRAQDRFPVTLYTSPDCTDPCKNGRDMLTKRIIPCLDVKDGRVVKGVNFVNLRDAGDPVEIARRYDAEGADELAFLDIRASVETRGLLYDMIEAVADQVFIPLTVGGGVNTVEDIRALLNAGADKVSLNTAALTQPSLISTLAARYGSQAVIVAIDATTEAGSRCVTITVASGKVAISAPSCSQCWGLLSTQVRGPRRNVNACKTFFMYA